MDRKQTFVESFEGLDIAGQGRKQTFKEDQSLLRNTTELEHHEDENKVLRYRPTQRHPMAVVSVHFDGLDEGERFAVRKTRCVVGRTEGDVCVEHDGLMSSQHFELYLPNENGARWRLRDLNSTNGTFARVNDVLLIDNSEFLIGNHRFKFIDVDNSALSSPENVPERNSTQAWQIPTADTLDEKSPVLEEVTPSGPGQRYPLNSNENLLGKDEKKCKVIIEDDPFVENVHAKIHKDEHGRWHLANLKSLNGTWYRVTETPIERTAQILAGEQRFTIYVP